MHTWLKISYECDNTKVILKWVEYYQKLVIIIKRGKEKEEIVCVC